MLVRRLRRRSFANVSEHVRTTLASKLSGKPELSVEISSTETQDVTAFVKTWNQVYSKCKTAGLLGAIEGVKLQVRDSGRHVVQYDKGELRVNLSKFSKNVLAAEQVAQELGRRLWAKKLDESQRKKVREANVGKDAELLFAKAFRSKLEKSSSISGKPKDHPEAAVMKAVV